VISSAILGDTAVDWRPTSFSYGHGGCRISIEFQIIELLVFTDQMERLRDAPNPFGVATCAHLISKQTKKEAKARKRWKLLLYRLLSRRGWPRARVIDLLDFCEYVLKLPADLDREMKEELYTEEEQREGALERRGFFVEARPGCSERWARSLSEKTR